MYAMVREFMLALIWIAGLTMQGGNADYDAGRRALDRGEWRQAVEAFDQVEDDAAEADAALYWRAYAYNKLGDANGAIESISELEERFPASEWRDDARALLSEVRGSYRAGESSEGDDDLKLMALNALMHRGDEDALPILTEFLAGDHSPRLKERALFILAQSGSDEAFDVVASVARDGSSPELQRKALRYLGVHSTERSIALLADLYESMDDPEARRSILRSFMIAGERDRLLQVARQEADVELRSRAIRLLGTMDATDELAELYRTESSEEVRRGILQAFMVAGDVPRLVAVARNESETEELRKAAIQLLATQDAQDELWSLYQETDSEELRKRILRGFFISRDTDRLASVARDEGTGMELRKAAVRSLGLVGEAGLPILEEIYRGDASREVREQVLHGMFLQQAVPSLIEIARNETDPELKKRAVHWLSLIDSPESKAFMMELLRS